MTEKDIEKMLAESEGLDMSHVNKDDALAKARRELYFGANVKSEQKEEKSSFARFFTSRRIVPALAGAALAIGLFAGAIGLYNENFQTVYIDINPSVALKLNRFDRVIGVEYLNDDAKALLIGDNVSDEFIAKIDYYHNIQGQNKEILDGVIENGGNLAIISKYGSTIPPVCVSQLNIGDMVIDTVYTSFGATCALANTTLGADYVQKVDCGHNHISADNMIDASTAAYPEYTWFIKDLMHADHTAAQWELIRFIFDSEAQPTVSDSEAYPQFLISIDDEIIPLTAENDTGKYGSDESASNGFLAKVISFFKMFINTVKNFISKLF